MKFTFLLFTFFILQIILFLKKKNNKKQEKRKNEKDEISCSEKTKSAKVTILVADSSGGFAK